CGPRGARDRKRTPRAAEPWGPASTKDRSCDGGPAPSAELPGGAGASAGQHVGRGLPAEDGVLQAGLHDLTLDAEQLRGPRPGPNRRELIERHAIVGVSSIEAA